MRKALLAVALVMVLAAGAQAASIFLDPSALTVLEGTTYTVDVVVTGVGAPNAESANIEVAFDPTLVNVLGANEGDFMAQQNPDLYLAFGYLLDNANGVLSYTFTRLGANTSSGSGTVAVLTFECMRPGPTALSYYLVLSDPEGNDLVAADGTARVDQTPIPEPMTLVLIGAAVTALGVVARKRS
jgi:hypothetical protein